MRWLRHTLGFLIALLIGIGILLPAATFVAPAFGFQIVAVRGHSMEPTIPIGSLIVVSERREVRPGDIVTWRTENGTWVTHRALRLVDENGETFIQTKGDANDTADAAAVPADSVVGVVQGWAPLAGYALAMLATPSGLVSWLSFGLALLVADSLLASMTPVQPAPRTRPGLGARLGGRLRELRRERAPGWPIHFEGTTLLGTDDTALLDAMARCADGDHRACGTRARTASSGPAVPAVPIGHPRRHGGG